MINVERSMDTVKISYRGDTLKKISLLFDDEVESE